MDNPASALAARLRSEGEKAAAFFGGLTMPQWGAEVYAEGQRWRARDLLAHFLSAERSFLLLFRDIAAGGPGVAPDFSVDRFNAEQVPALADVAPEELLRHFRAARAEMADWVAGLSEHDLERRGRHPALGECALGEMIRMVFLHNQLHLRDLRRALEDA